jgi:hypothetical protein
MTLPPEPYCWVGEPNYPEGEPMYTLKFWKLATERAVKTAAQAVALAIGTTAAFDAIHADWGYLGSMALGGAVLSYLTSVITSGAGPDNDPSAV